MFKEISTKAPFPGGTRFGNSFQVLQERISGDADDYALSRFGIPAVTSELGAQS
jgi:hypothetical protein